MKSMLLFLLLILGVACTGLNSLKPKFSNVGVAVVLNGRNETDSLKYTCDSCYEILKDKQVFDTVISIATSEAKEMLRNKLSFKPLSVDINIVREDSLYYSSGKKIDSLVSIIAKYKCIGKNAYGVEDEVETTSIIYLRNNNVINLFGKIRKIPLRLSDENVVNRSLSLVSEDGEVVIQPAILNGNIHLIVITDESCVEDSRLTIQLNDTKEITLRSWNKFNCDKTSYFKLTQAQLETLKNSPIKYVSFSEDKFIFCPVPENEQDYFIQYVNLLKS